MTAAELASALRGAGARQLPDVLFFPVAQDRGRQWAHYGLTRLLTRRHTDEQVFMRSATLPFDLLNLRPTDYRRNGVYFSLGPGFLPDGQLAEVVLIQAQSEDCGVSRSLLTPHIEALSTWADGLSRCEDVRTGHSLSIALAAAHRFR